jgi:phosphate transport system substrate-binding protein
MASTGMSTSNGPFEPNDIDIDREEAIHFRAKRRRRMINVGVVVVLLVLVGAGAGWATGWFTHAPPNLRLAPPCAGSVNLTGAGSTFVAPLMTMWTAAFGGSKGCVTVHIGYNGSNPQVGLAQLGSGATDFLTTEEPLNVTALATLPAPVLTLPITTGAVAVAYNIPGLTTALNLSASVLAGIYMGTIASWNDTALAAINPGVHLPSDLPIEVIHGAPGSSTSYVLTGFLARNNATWSSDVGQGATVAWPTGSAASGDAGAASALQSTPGGIAYLGLSYALQDGLTCARIQNPAGDFVAPSSTNITAATAVATAGALPPGNASWQGVSLLDAAGNSSYPLTTFTYAITYSDLDQIDHGALSKNAALWLASFLYWVSIDAQYYATPLSFGPLPSHVILGDVQIIELLRYQGGSALGDIDSDGD